MAHLDICIFLRRAVSVHCELRLAPIYSAAGAEPACPYSHPPQLWRRNRRVRQISALMRLRDLFTPSLDVERGLAYRFNQLCCLHET